MPLFICMLILYEVVVVAVVLIEPVNIVVLHYSSLFIFLQKSVQKNALAS